jgi:hypothetical protein
MDGLMKGLISSDLLQLLNTGSLKQLKKLHLIGPKRAELIVTVRGQKPFTGVCAVCAVCCALLLEVHFVCLFVVHVFAMCVCCVQLQDLRSIGMSEKQCADFLKRNVMSELFPQDSAKKQSLSPVPARAPAPAPAAAAAAAAAPSAATAAC